MMFDNIDFRSSEARVLVNSMKDQDLHDLGTTIGEILYERTQLKKQLSRAEPEQPAFLSGSNQAAEQGGQGHSTLPFYGNPVEDIEGARLLKERVGEEETIENMAFNLRNETRSNIPMVILKMICRNDVREFKNRKAVQELDKRSIINLEIVNDAHKEIVKLHQLLKGKTDVINMIFESLREHEVNIKSAFSMAEEAKLVAEGAQSENSLLHLRIHEISRANNELNQMINGGDGSISGRMDEMARQLKAVQSRLAKEWDKKRR